MKHAIAALMIVVPIIVIVVALAAYALEQLVRLAG